MCSLTTLDASDAGPRWFFSRLSPATVDGSLDEARGSCPIHACGNCRCERGETFAPCPEDCTPRCDNGVCKVEGENDIVCPLDCDPSFVGTSSSPP